MASHLACHMFKNGNVYWPILLLLAVYLQMIVSKGGSIYCTLLAQSRQPNCFSAMKN